MTESAKLKLLSGLESDQLINCLNFDNLLPANSPVPAITADRQLDQHIRRIAEKRGY